MLKKKTSKWLTFCILALSLIVTACGGGGGQAPAPNQGTAPQPEAEAPKSDFPKRPINLLVTFAPGGGTDVVARALAEAANKHLPNKQTIVVENKPGGGGTLGATEVVTSAADGYTIGITAISPLAILPHYGNTAYTLEDVEPLAQVASTRLVMAVKNDAPWQSFDEWLEYAKANPKAFKYAVPGGTGGSSHLTMEAMSKAAGIQTQAIPYDGTAPALTALLGGHVAGAIVQDVEAKQFVESGDVRLLFTTGPSDVYPELTVLKDKGIDFEVGVFTAIFAPKGLPAEVRDILADAFEKGTKEPSFTEIMDKQGVTVKFEGPEQFNETVHNISDTFGQIIKDLGITQQ